MVKVSSEQKPYRKEVMTTYGAKVIPSPSNTTEAGRRLLAQFPETGGSLGCAISEAVEKAVTTPNCKYVLGSVLDHVLLHQSVIGLESKTALDKYGVTPDVVIGCVGGGSNFGGLIAPFMADKLQGKNDTRFVGVEPASCPSMTRGKYAYDFCDSGRMAPLARCTHWVATLCPRPTMQAGLGTTA
jgi:tryptophan synthase beta chain